MNRPSIDILDANATSDALVRAIGRDGAVLLRGVVDPTTIAAVTTSAIGALEAIGLGPSVPRRALSARGWDDPRWLELQVRVLGSEAVAALRDDLGLRTCLNDIAGHAVIGAQGDVVRVSFAGQPELTTRPHQDGFYIPDSHNLLTAWLPLVPCPLELGPLAVIPGSHVAGVKPHTVADLGVPELSEIAKPHRDDIVAGVGPWWSNNMRPGDALVFTAQTVHGTLPNTTADSVRLSIDLRFR